MVVKKGVSFATLSVALGRGLALEGATLGRGLSLSTLSVALAPASSVPEVVTGLMSSD